MEYDISFDELDDIVPNSNLAEMQIDTCSQTAEPSVPLIVSEAFIVAFGLIFNGIAIFVIIQLKDYKKVVSHWYVLHLSIADLLLLLHLPFKTSQHFYGYWIYASWFCTYNQGIFMTSYYAGILFLTVMSFDRYVAIVHPVSAKWRKIRTRYNANIVTLVVWTLSFLFSIPLWVFSTAKNCSCGYNFGTDVHHTGNFSKTGSFADFYEYDENQVYYGEDYITNVSIANGDKSVTKECKYEESQNFTIWLVCNFVITFIVPIIIMGICYSLILWRVLHPAITSSHTTSHRRRKSSENSTRKDSQGKTSFRSNSSSSTGSSHRLSRKGKVTLVVASLVACFLLCWFPFHLVHLIKNFRGIPVKHVNRHLCTVISNITHILAYSNSMLNPILYTFLGSDFRRRLKTATTSFRRRRFSSGISKGNRTARTSVPTYGRSHGNGTATHHKAMEGPTAYPMNTIHSIISKHYSQDMNERSQFVSSRRTECSSKCEMDALQYSDMSESRLIH